MFHQGLELCEDFSKEEVWILFLQWFCHVNNRKSEVWNKFLASQICSLFGEEEGERLLLLSGTIDSLYPAGMVPFLCVPDKDIAQFPLDVNWVVPYLKQNIIKRGLGSSKKWGEWKQGERLDFFLSDSISSWLPEESPWSWFVLALNSFLIILISKLCYFSISWFQSYAIFYTGHSGFLAIPPTHAS